MHSILLVDDEPDIRLSLQKLLSLEGYEVDIAEHGAEALEKLGRRSPDLIIADYMMPFMSGKDFCRQVKSGAATAHIPIIMSSAVPPPPPSYWNAYLRKPVDFATLLATVRRLLKGAQRER